MKHLYSFSLLGVCLMSAALTVTAAEAETKENWRCEDGHISSALNSSSDEVKITWNNKQFRLQRQETKTGAKRYFDEMSGMDWVVIPTKAMLFNRKEGRRLADNCQHS